MQALDVKQLGKVLTAGLVISLLTACGQAPRTYLQGSAADHNKSRLFSGQVGVCKDNQYIVKEGDSLSLVAKKCQVDMLALARVNDLRAPFVIYPGQEMVLPKGYEQVVKKSVDWSWPVKHYESHQIVQGANGVKGLEIYAEKGSLVQAVAAGQVVFADKSLSNFGNLVILRHDDEYLTVYAHNDRLQVKEGQLVERGQLIANVGDSGGVKQPMLYFEARFRGQKVDVDQLLTAPK